MLDLLHIAADCRVGRDFLTEVQLVQYGSLACIVQT